MTILTRTTLLLSLGLATAACKKSSPAPGGSGSAAAKPPAGGSAAPAADPLDQAKGRKMQLAVECLNHYSNTAFDARRTYLESVDATTGLAASGKPAIVGLAGVELCQLRLKSAGEVTPAVPEIDEPFATYVAATTALDAAWVALKGYYDRGEAVDDKGAKAATLHPAVVAAFDTFRDAHRALHGVIGKLTRERSLAQIAAREKAEGRKLEVIIESLMVEADTLVELAGSADATTLPALQAGLAAYDKVVAEMTTYAAAHPDETKARGSWTNLQNYANTYLAAAKNVVRKLTEKAPLGESDAGDVTKQYNLLVDNYNRH